MDDHQQQTTPFGGRGSTRGGRGRGSFGNANSRADSIFNNNETTEQQQTTFCGRGGTRGGRGRGSFGNDTSQTKFSDNSSTTNDQRQTTTFIGRGGTRGGRGRGSFGNSADNYPISDNNSTTSNQQQSTRGKAVIRSWRGNNRGNSGSVGSRTSSTSDLNNNALNDHQSTTFGGRGGNRGGRSRGSFGNIGSRTNSNSDVRETTALNDQQPTFIGRGGSRGGRGRGNGGNSFPQTNTSTDFNNSSITTNDQQFRGRGSFRGGRVNGRGNFGSGANSVPLLESISVERPSRQNNNFNNDFERRQRPRQQSFSNASDDEFSRRRPSTRYIPIDKPIEEVFAEDQECKEIYIDVTDNDDQVEIIGVGDGAQKIFEKWDELNLHPELYENIKKAKYIRPRKIQSYVIPYIIDGYDLKGHSETGSGKTAAFAIPIIQKILSTPEFKRTHPGPAPLAIIIEPTRELCIQVYNQFRKFADGTFIKVCKVYGETNMRVAITQVERGCDILIGTPGRIKHFIVAKFVNISKMKFFVLDEVDHMLNTHFWDDIQTIRDLDSFPTKSNRQCLLFSATFPPEIQQLATELLRDNYVYVSNKKPVSPNTKIVQNFHQVETSQKKDFLLEMLKNESAMVGMNNNNTKLRRTLVFVGTRRDADLVSVYLCENDIKSSTINADRSQFEREDALRKFDKGEIDVLVATDVLARGIDIKNLNHVINFDLPNDDVTYVHRIGRTGRLGVGYATSFVDLKDDAYIIQTLVDLLIESDIDFPAFMNGHINRKSEFASKDTQSQDENNNICNDDDDW
ncbi:hypothetical protein ACQ4LE_006596 [Meloidogyne hapla]